MITHINIKDFATIEQTEIEFHKGLNILTGETGAGKSILIQAISLALGNRADHTFVRTGADKAIIQLVAELDNQDTIITREISTSGKSICKVNGEMVTLGQLSAITSKLADVHGQYDQQSLLHLENHLKLVDIFEKEAITPVKQKVDELFTQYKDACKTYEEMKLLAEGNDRKREFLIHEMEEIQKANLILGEDSALEEELVVLKNREVIHEHLEKTYNLAYGDDYSALSHVDSVITAIRDISTMSKEASSLEDELSDVYYRFEDVCRHLLEAKDRCVYSPEEIDIINDRLYTINGLKQKYGDTIDAILEQGEKKEKELYKLKNIDSELESSLLEKSTIGELLFNELERLTNLRRSSASTLERKIQEELDALNFQNAEVFIDFEKVENFTSNGQDKVEFLISTNKGEQLKPLAKIASGGEMSRIMLAFKKIIGDYDNIPTMIFDEIDSGISGEAAGIVGKALSNLSDSHQIISITHLPQIAACGDHNYRIQKLSDDEKTYTSVEHLNDEEKVVEIARLLSGINISDLTIQSAKEMITMSK